MRLEFKNSENHKGLKIAFRMNLAETFMVLRFCMEYHSMEHIDWTSTCPNILKSQKYCKSVPHIPPKFSLVILFLHLKTYLICWLKMIKQVVIDKL